MPLYLIVVLCFLACSKVDELTKFSGQTMGTYWHVTLAAPLDKQQAVMVEQKIKETLSAVNQEMSTYIENSQLSLFNRSAANTPFPLTADMFSVISTGLKISEQTAGRYDISIGPLVNLWGFGADKISNAPNAGQIAAMRKVVGYQKLHLEGQNLLKDVDELQIDLSSIAKGFAVDKVAREIERLGYHDYLVEVGGEIVAAGQKYDRPWQVGIEKPENGRHVQAAIALKGRHTAIASSGNYRNFIDYDGERAVHTIDPRTGYPVHHTLLATTVVGEQCMMADAYATALMVLGEEAPAFADAHQLAAMMIFSDGDKRFKIVRSQAFIAQFGEQ